MVRVRMAPSPTGFIHIGNLRTGLYNELFARNQNGSLILRFEDTDRSRYVEGAMESYCRSLKAMNLIPDEGAWIDENDQLIEQGDFGPYIQSKRQQTHQDYAQKLIEMGHAYPCFCTEARLTEMRKAQQQAGEPTRYDRHCRSLDKEEAAERIRKGEKHVIRLAVPTEGSVSFTDEVRGEVTFEWKEVDDQVIIKSDGMPTYHLAAICDDHDMRITHVIRGEEWISSTPKHLFIYQSFGWEPPKLAHLPLLLNADRSKLSKRQGDVAVEDYLKKGYLPEALLNFVALLGWNPTGDREQYSHEELIKLFDLAKVNKGGAVVNFEKLDWLNSQYLRALSEKAFADYARAEIQTVTEDAELQNKIAHIIRERIVKYEDIQPLAEDLMSDVSSLNAAIIPWKTQRADDAAVKLTAVLDLFKIMPQNDWESPEALELKIKKMIEDHGWKNGEVLWPLRIALSGKKQSPPPFDLLYLHGYTESKRRVERAIELLNGTV
ncbi:glutamate--tRNA ligase [Candidatus Uhrbacteria bacterium]|nr:glutamate--tRNA ligase [Candidatus Uhrbacteria bacterium]MBD3284204.1 glutamate--tRNA ligase [Candidatus Uhrbacteria bacterium]